MKNFKIAFIALFAVVLSSCGDDDGPGFQFNQENLVGTYEITFYREVDTETVQLTNSTVTETITIDADTFTNARVVITNTTIEISGQYRATEITRVDGAQTDRDEYIDNFDGTPLPYTINQDDRSINVLGQEIRFTRFSSNDATLEVFQDFGDGDSFESETRVRRLED